MEFTKKQKLTFGIAILITLLLVGVVAYLLWNNHTKQEEKIKQATIMSAQQATDINYLKNALKQNEENAKMLANFIERAQMGQVQPVTNFTVQAQSLPQAAQQVTERINAKDPTLPPAALEKTDNTIVVPNQNKTTQANYDVAVFKNNNYRNWEWSVGYGVQDGNQYIPVGLQRNYSKDKAIEAEVHLDPGNVKKVTGGELKKVWKTDKLFGLF